MLTLTLRIAMCITSCTNYKVCQSNSCVEELDMLQLYEDQLSYGIRLMASVTTRHRHKR